MKFNKKITVYVFLSILLGFALGVTAGDRFLKHPPHRFPDMKVDSQNSSEKGFTEMLNLYGAKLNLNDTQREQVKSVLALKQNELFAS